MAIAGVPATAWEMARVLEHSFHLSPQPAPGNEPRWKVRALSKLLRTISGLLCRASASSCRSLPPTISAADAARLYFYDAMGAQFEATDYAATGSGSGAVRSILYYQNSWGAKPLRKLRETDAVPLALRALDTAAESDTATGGVDRRGKVYPIVKIIGRSGITTLPEKQLARMFRKVT
jgi:proteasome beta subunit